MIKIFWGRKLGIWVQEGGNFYHSNTRGRNLAWSKNSNRKTNWLRKCLSKSTDKIVTVKFKSCTIQTNKNLRFTGEDLAVCSRMRVCVTGQHDRQVKFLAGQVTIQVGHCLLTCHYFKPCKQWNSKNQIIMCCPAKVE